jgi:hypothetical protein
MALRKSLMLLSLGIFCTSIDSAFCGNFRIRLREHFEFLSIRYESLNDSENYFGLTNTANLWYEKPMHYGIGLAVGPVLGSASSVNDSAPMGTDTKIRLWNIGVETKYFFYPEKKPWFGRIGLTGNILDTRGSAGKLGGGGYYLGLGFETKIWKIGLAPEIAFRHVLLEQGSSIYAFTPSIGVHFYVLPKDE